MLTLTAPFVRDMRTWINSVLNGTTMMGSPSSQTVTLMAYQAGVVQPNRHVLGTQHTHHPVVPVI